MPNLNSAKKNIRKSLKKQAAHKKSKEEISKLLKTKGADLTKAQSLIDKAAKKGIFHKNKAGRLVAKLRVSK
jgi:ribosomal protein S20